MIVIFRLDNKAEFSGYEHPNEFLTLLAWNLSLKQPDGENPSLLEPGGSS